MKRDLCLESRFARVDLQSINLYIVFFTLPMCMSNDLILHWGRGYIMFVCYRHSKVHVQTNDTPLCNLFNKPVYPFKNFIPKKCVPSALKIWRGTSVIQKQDLLLEYLIEFICDESISMKSMREKPFSLHNTPIFLSIRKGFGPQT